MSWSNQQEAAIKAVRRWLADKNGPQVFRLFGFAGTGKTTLARELAGGVTGAVVFACFTGKAALVLLGKGCPDAQTIHSLIYRAVEDASTGDVHFVLNPDSPASTADLIVIDEVSMVGKDLGLDLLSFGTKVLVLGDPAQLPPVKGEGYFINAEPDAMLTEVHRQAADNPIIRMSMDVREGRGLQVGDYGDSRVIRRGSIDRDAMREIVIGADQLLCGLNRTRQTFNARVREIRGNSDPMPVPGDRLVCLKNNRESGLLNGGMWEVAKVYKSPAGGKPLPLTGLRVKSLDNPAQGKIDVAVPREFWTGEEKKLDWRQLRQVDQFTYGYCLTCHKSQGSQWPSVAVFDESRVFREDADRHLYTAVTRAADQVTVIV